MGKIIGVVIDGETSWHAANVGTGPDYATLCGIDPDDPAIGHTGTVEPKRGQKITCQECFNAWRGVVDLALRQSDFSLDNA
jgi:hypothetical protein